MSGYFEHISSDGDRLDLLAWHYYGDATAYEQIVRANPGLPIWPIYPQGVRILIPVVDAPAEPELSSEGLPPWLI